MPIVLITGAKSSGKSTIARALRDNSIRQKQGCFLIDDISTGEVAQHFEKILMGESFDPKKPLAEQKWKPSPTIVLAGDKGQAFYNLAVASLPGFKKFFGPVLRVTTGVDE